MKKTMVALSIGLISVVFADCSHLSALKTKSWQRSQNKQMGFEIKTPPGWKVVEEMPNFVRLSDSSASINNFGIPAEGMWVDVRSEDKCLPDPGDDFYVTNYGLKGDPPKYLFQKFSCKGNLEIQTCFWSSDSKGEKEKKLMKAIVSTIKLRP